MELFSAIENRRSCRNFSGEPIQRDTIERIIQAGTWAPSPLNMQPWQFVVISGGAEKGAIFAEADRCRKWAIAESGWKWLEGYSMEFLKEAPVIIAVVGDPKKSGVDMYQEEGKIGYQLACAAAIQNMLLAAHALGLGSLWFTFFDKKEMRKILDIPVDKTPVALICIGKARDDAAAVPRKDVKKVVRYTET